MRLKLSLKYCGLPRPFNRSSKDPSPNGQEPHEPHEKRKYQQVQKEEWIAYTRMSSSLGERSWRHAHTSSSAPSSL